MLNRLSLSALEEQLRQAQAQPVSFAFEALCKDRAALKAAKAVKDRSATRAAQARIDRKKSTPWYVCAAFSDNRRLGKSCTAVSAIVGDADQSGTTLARLREVLDPLNVAYLIHTSTSHGCEGQERYRVIVPLAEPVAPQRYAAVWQWLSNQLPGMLDSNAKDPTRLNYMPRVPVGATGHQIICVGDRPWFDASSIAPTDTTPVELLPSVSENILLTEITEEQRADLRSALAHPPLLQAAAGREVWAQVGIWLLSIGEKGRQLWEEFSAAAPNGKPEDATDWWQANQNTKPGKDFRAIYRMASSTYGWVNPDGERRNRVTFEPIAQQLRLQTTESGRPLSNVRNATLVLAQQTSVALSFDEFLDRTVVCWPGESKHFLSDADATRIQIELQRLGMVSMSSAAARDAATLVAHKNPTNVITDYLSALQWDGQRRLSTLMPRGFGTTTDEYHSCAGPNLLVGMVARAFDPGCQVDECIVLEGDQGAFKSSALRILGGAYFAELTADANSKDFEHQLRGVWLGEFPELHALRRADDVARIKQFITNRVDHYRPPYAREMRDYPRRAVLCGSTNESCWIHDHTGGRRFIPITVGTIDLQWIKSNRDQLFAEAVTMYRADHRWWVYPKDETLEKQHARMPSDPWEAKVAAYLHGRTEIADPSELLDHALNVSPDRQNHSQLIRVGTLLRKLGCQQQNRRRVNGRLARPWFVPAEYASLPCIAHGPIAFTPVSKGVEDLV